MSRDDVLVLVRVPPSECSAVHLGGVRRSYMHRVLHCLKYQSVIRADFSLTFSFMDMDGQGRVNQVCPPFIFHIYFRC